MKKLFVVMGLLLIATMLFVGCKGKTDNSSTTQNQLPAQDYNKTGTLQGKVMDAVTGNALGNDANSELKMWLIQGTSDRGPDKLITDPNDPLRGEYAFSGIPVSLDFSDDSCFKVVVVKSGYQRFESEDVCLGSASDSFDNSSIVILDGVINVIGNIYLFPVDLTAADANVYVVNSANKPVPGATVILVQNIASNTLFVQTDRLPAANGLISSLTTTTDATGKATFAGSSLVLNGLYTPTVLPILFDGQQLEQKAGTAFFIGVDNPTQYVTMNAAGNGAYLYVTASNNLPKAIISDGVLTITFNRTIALAGGMTTTGVCNATVNTGNAVIGAPTVTAAVSPDGLTLTLTPNITTVATTPGSSIEFTCNAGSIIATEVPTVAAVNPLTISVNNTTSTLTTLGSTIVQTLSF
jgi:hypothetical protein